MAAVMSGKLWGYINQQGKFIIKPIFEYASPFKEDKAYVVTQDNFNNYIDHSGRFLFAKEKRGFSIPQEGRIAVVRISDWKWGFIDYMGNIIVDYKYDDCIFTGADYGPNPADDPFVPYVFVDGRIPICLNNNFGFIDINGKPITECIYDDVRYFQYGLSAVSLNGKKGLLDKNGKYVLQAEFDQIGQVTDSFIALSKNGKWGFVDHTGTLVIPYQYDFAESFRADRSKIGVKGTGGELKYGYIDKEGKWVMKAIYDNAYTFDSKGYAIVEIGNKSGVIDKNGKYVIPLTANIKFDALEGYKNGDVKKLYYRDYVQDGILIYFSSDSELKGFMRIDGKRLTDPIFYEVEQFQNGIAKVSQLVGQFDDEGTKTGYIDTSGKYIWKPSR